MYFHGFVVFSEEIFPDPSKLYTVRTFPVPKSLKDVRSFLRLCNYYRRFVKDFAKIASPLNRLMRKHGTVQLKARLLQLLMALNVTSHILLVKKFYVHTDHGSLSWLRNVKDPTGRLARWALALQQFDFEIHHCPGVQNGVADALSRRTYGSSMLPNAVPLSLPVTVIDHPCPSSVPLRTLQRQDANLYDIIAYLEHEDLPSTDVKARSLLLSIG